MSEIKCILHLANRKKTESEDIKPFDSITWGNVCRASESRKNRFKTSKFFTIELPGSYDDSCGYHSSCYKDYTAVPLDEQHEDDSTIQEGYTLRKSIEHTASTSSTGVFPKECIFCKKAGRLKISRDKSEALTQCMTDGIQDSVLDAVKAVGDKELEVKLTGVDFVAKEVHYHRSCFKGLLNVARDLKDKPTSQHEEPWRKMHEYILSQIVKTDGAELLTSLHKRYMEWLGQDDTAFLAHHLEVKILKEFKEDVLIANISKKKGNVVYSCNISKEVAIRRAFFDEHGVKEAALKLRQEILQMETTSSSTYSVDRVINGDGDPPSIVKTFFRVLFTGNDNEDLCSDKITRLVNSASDDVVFSTTRGRIKPAKHMCVGIGIKSLTGSKRVIDIMNRYGGSISYSVAEEIETDIAFAITQKGQALPDGMVKLAGLGTGLAWDNYDENAETLSGSGTVHDTVGICIQDLTDAPPIVEEEQAGQHINIEEIHDRKQRKRLFEAKECHLKPYRKKPKMSKFDFRKEKVPRPVNLTDMHYRDLFWMMSLNLKETPMWGGYNSLIMVDPLPIQKIGYMENIPFPPTRLDVVAKTLQVTQQVAQECGEEYIAVTYDLAIAKPAIQMQIEEAPLYDNLFVCFGPFHTMLAYFGSLGWILDGSGGPYILIEAGVLAPGSLNGFLKGKHYNRCKRLHPMLATAFRILHFRSFLETHPMPQAMLDMLNEMSREASPDKIQEFERSDAYTEFMESYMDYTEETMSGAHGSTAQYWMGYASFVDIYLLFSRACRTSDVDLYTYELDKMDNVFFATFRPNYARWMLLFSLKLLNIESTHPGLKQVLENGGLSVRRTPKNFSRAPVDITLEQTVNADAASRRTGIAAFTTNESARRRWMVTRSARSAIVGELMDKTGLKSKEDISKELSPKRIQRDNADIQSIINSIERTMNPFTLQPSSELFCLATGKALPEPIKVDLLQCYSKGKEWRNEFQTECAADPSRFEKPIKKRKIKNASQAAVKAKVTTKDQKLVEVQGTRDLFGRLLYLSTTSGVDMENVLRFPLTPVPLALGHVDGTMNSADKSKLLHKIEDMCVHNPPQQDPDIAIVDAMMLMNSLTPPPTTYGSLAKEVLGKLVALAPSVHMVCDTYMQPSIKDLERSKRGEPAIVPVITGPDQRITNYHEYLRSGQWKTSLFRFLAEEWKEKSYAHDLEGKNLYMAFDEQCIHYTALKAEGPVVWKEVPELSCSHEEADTRIIFHLVHVIEQDPDAIISVRADDTDIFINLLFHVLRTGGNVWMDVGKSSNNTRRFISITQLVEKLGADIVRTLPSYHAFTGCDFTASFLYKAKTKPYDIMVDTKKYQKRFITAFTKLGERAHVLPSVINSLQQFVCTMYGKPKCSGVDKARYEMYVDMYAPKAKDAPLQRLKRANPSTLPPCQTVLINKINRANYVSYIWKHAHQADPLPPNTTPVTNGWQEEKGKYIIKWFIGDQMPKDINPERINEESDEDSSDYDSEEDSEDDSEEDSDDEDSWD